MMKTQTSLKTKNALYLWTFIGANCALFLAVIIAGQINYSALDHFWQRVSAKDGLIAACMPLISIVLDGVLSDSAKARLVFWRWKNPLPACRAFSELMHTDPRVNIAALKAKHGLLPRSPKDQNVLWYQIYQKHAEALTVCEGHKIYLLTRDMTSMSAIFLFAFSICSFFSSIQKEVFYFYCVALVIQYLILSTAARNNGKRFVLNVLTQDSHAS
jgi:hypothetical protein